jgi:hypothetical protein
MPGFRHSTVRKSLWVNAPSGTVRKIACPVQSRPDIWTPVQYGFALATSRRIAAGRTRSGRGPGRATRAALPASCAGSQPWRTTGPGRGQPVSAVPVVTDGRRGLDTSSGPQRETHALRARNWPGGLRLDRRAVRWQPWRTTGPGPGRLLSAVPVVADGRRGLGTSSRTVARDARAPGADLAGQPRAALRASCAGGRGARPGQVVASFSAPFRSWPMAGAAWGHRAGPQRETHALRARAWPRSSRRIAGVVRWWTWPTTGPAPGRLLSAVPVVADGRRGLGASSRTAARDARAPGADLAGQPRAALRADGAGSPARSKRVGVQTFGQH